MPTKVSRSTAASQNRRNRQESLRELLVNQGHVQHVVEILTELGKAHELSTNEIARNKLIIDTKLKLINKYLPDLKAVEISGDQENPLTFTEVVRKIIGPSDEPTTDD